MKNFLSLISILVFLIFGCTENPEDDMSVENYMPLAVGNIWIYRYENSELDTMEIVGSYNWKGMEIFQERIYNPFYWYYDNGRLKCWYYERPSDTGYCFIELKEPLEAGNKWLFFNDPHSPSYLEDTMEITVTGLTITVEAGYFEDCIKVEEGKQYWIYAPDVGLIKWRAIGAGAYGEDWGKELIEYELK